MDTKTQRIVALAALLVAFASAGCSDDPAGTGPSDAGNPDGGGGDGGSGDVGAAAPLPVAPSQGETCLLDIDCAPDRFCFAGICSVECASDDDCGGDERCSDRGRCVVSGGSKSLDDSDEAAAPDYVEGVRFVELPSRVQPVPAGSSEIVVRAVASGPIPPEGIAYRVETEEPGSEGQVRRAEVNGETISFALPTGAADPLTEVSNRVEANVVSAIGSFRVTMIPAPPVGGLYSGEARVNRLGNMSVPLQFMVVTDPPDATLENADAAWLLLPIGESEVFSPHEPYDGPDWQARPLEFDRIVDAWAARFDNEFRFADDSVIGPRPPGQVGRTLRFEVSPRPENTLVGSITDRWSGLFDERNEAGVLVPAIVTYAAEFEVRRFGAAVDRAEFEVAALNETSPELLPLPPVDACDDSMLDVGIVEIGDTSYSCAGIGTVAAFVDAEPEARAACAIAVAEASLLGDTTVELLTQYLDGDDITPGGESFADFMERCAGGVDGACRPSEETRCGRQLVAYAYVAQEDEVASSPQLVDSFEATTREAFLGRQLGAFQTDANLRLEWLRTSDYPAIVTSAVEELNAALLDEWVAGVLDVHFQVLSGQFDPSGIAVLSRQATSEETAERRRTLLFDMTQGWRAAMESLVLATQRWNILFRDDASRRDKQELVASRMLDLYVLAGLAGNLNQRAGSGFANAAFGGGFGALRRELRKLELPFNELIYARDAEVVVSTSLDPLSDNSTVLSEARELALTSISEAQDAVSTILAEAQARALSENQLRNQLDNDLEEARGGLVELCGLPVGCRVADYPGERDCAVRIEAGECGFAIDRFTGAFENYAGQPVTTSDAGRAMMSVLDAINNLNIVESEANAHFARSAQAYSDAAAFANRIEEWNRLRQETLDEIDETITERADQWNETLRELTENIAEREQLRADAIADAREAQDEWETVEAEGRREQMAARVATTVLLGTAQALRASADDTFTLGQIAKEGFPTVTGTSNDVTSAGRVGVLMAAYSTARIQRGIATGLEITARVAEQLAQYRARETELRIRDIQQESQFADREYLAQIEALEDEVDRMEIEEGVRDAAADRLIDSMQRAAEYELAYQRDLIELQDRRSAAWGLLQDNATMILRIVEAQFDVEQRVFEYLEVVQRAELLYSRIQELESQQQSVNLLLGSPAVVFSWANRLLQAELRLERAKSALMDWLVAMEYFAVRPFMDQRIQILLARNPYQLEAIASEMRRLERACGGLQSEQSSTVRLSSLLGVADPMSDAEGQQVYTPGEQLRAALERGSVPVDTRTRYSTRESIGDLLNRGSVWAATVSLDLERFANLASTCNAKVVSFDVQLVGDDLGDARPTVTILYDGMSQLRSCQPGIAEYVENFGPESTSFNEVTTFRTPARSVSPVAGINAYPSDDGGSGNLSLAGLPLASQYTILIDRQIGENTRVDWNRLEDIELRVHYAYQDVFPVGQCE